MIDLDVLEEEAAVDGRRPVVGALILDPRGRVFVHRRGPDRAFLPNGWDVVGAHVDTREGLRDALRREVTEETGWSVIGEPQLIFVGDWWTDPTDLSTGRREFDFLVDVEGDLNRPRLEWPKHTAFRWISAEDLSVLDENRGRDAGIVRHLAELGLRSATRGRLTYPHATLFLEPTAAGPVEALRRRWDPALAAQIAAHVTVSYPEEVDSLDELAEQARNAATRISPFSLRLGAFSKLDGTHAWVGVEVGDRQDGWRRLRELVVPRGRRRDVRPHVTVVHPRHSNLGTGAWAEVASRSLGIDFRVTELTITAFDGKVWRTTEQVPLDGP